MFILPQFKVTFTPTTAHPTYDWIVDGDDQLDALCKILRRNGITYYTVQGHNPFAGQQVVVEAESERTA